MSNGKGSKMRILIGLSALALVSACGKMGGSVYDQPIPVGNDPNALISIRDQLKPEDQAAWSAITLKKMLPAAPAIQAKTVGEALTREKALDACEAKYKAEMDAASTDEIGVLKEGQTDKYNAGVNGYNGCLKITV